MTIEDDLRTALRTEAARVDPADGWEEIQARVEAEQRRRRFRTGALGGLAAAAVVAILAVAVPMVTDDDRPTIVDTGVAGPGGDDADPEPDPPAPPVDGAEEDFAGIWPFSDRQAADAFPDLAAPGFAGSPDVEYTDAEATALDFAARYLGFPDPVAAEAAVAVDRPEPGQAVHVVSPRPGSPFVTVVVLDRSGAGAWSVVRAESPNIEAAPPDGSGAGVTSPVAVAGRATAFEGTVQVEVRQAGMRHGESLGEGFGTGGSMGELGPFETSISFERPTGSTGAIVLTTTSMEDGSVQEATVVPITFADDPAPDATGEMTVTAFFTRAAGDPADPEVVPVERTVPQTEGVLRASLEVLLSGPTDEERAAGLSSSFSLESADKLRGVSIDVDGRATVDLDPDLAVVTPNASTSAGSSALLAEIQATVLQFDTVESVELRFDGDCEAFWNWLQRGCTVVRRGDTP